jgi:hypothetical protein
MFLLVLRVVAFGAEAWGAASLKVVQGETVLGLTALGAGALTLAGLGAGALTLPAVEPVVASLIVTAAGASSLIVQGAATLVPSMAVSNVPALEAEALLVSARGIDAE